MSRWHVWGQVLEVVAETDAPLRPLEELLAAAPSDVSQAEKLAQRRAAQERQQQLDAALGRVRVHARVACMQACLPSPTGQETVCA
jgi:hypothetical protein